MERRIAVFAACAFVVAAVFYSAWVPGQFASPGVDRINGYVSELAARDQPWSMLFRLCDAVAGLACLAGVALVRYVRAERLGWLGLAVFGLGTLADSVFVLDCAALSDPACESGPLSFSHHAHTVTSALATVGVLVSMVALSLRRRSPLAWVITVATLAATAFTLAAVVVGELAGLAQRAQVALIALWLLYVAVHLLNARAVPVEQGPVHVLTEGAGPAVLVSAGLGGAWFHWDQVAAGLRPTHRVIRFDRPGLGLSPPSLTPPSLYGEAARLAALAPGHPGKVVVVGHSVAAWHAEAFARLHPLRVAGLVLVDPSCEPAPRRGTSPSGRAWQRWLPALGETWGAAVLARMVAAPLHRVLTGAADPLGVYRTGRVLAASASEWLAYRDMAVELRAIRAGHGLPAVPVVVISAGKRDRCQEELAKDLDAHLVSLPGSGHQVELEHPAIIVTACGFNGE